MDMRFLWSLFIRGSIRGLGGEVEDFRRCVEVLDGHWIYLRQAGIRVGVLTIPYSLE